jgi:hypothetical protein
MWEQVKTEMRRLLIQVARVEATISYSELASSIQTTYIHHRNPKFMRLLIEIADEDVQHNRPSLAVLVVNKATGRPGEGFFIEIEPAQREIYWQKRFDEICDYWQTHKTHDEDD